ncbi:hypothetical protein HK405_008655 [Cladochytrium tenue]|nr:hypothetical protein HK405_008655 [Cladochytrium tenue]
MSPPGSTPAAPVSSMRRHSTISSNASSVYSAASRRTAATSSAVSPHPANAPAAAATNDDGSKPAAPQPSSVFPPATMSAATTTGAAAAGPQPRRRRRVWVIAAAAVVGAAVVAAAVAAAVVLTRRSSSVALPSPPAASAYNSTTISGTATAYSASNVGRYQNSSAGASGSGVSAIHAALMVGTGKVAFLERWDIHGTKATLEDGSTAWSTEYDYSTDTFRALTLKTNIFCAGGMLLPDGRLAVIGGAENHSAYSTEVGGLADGMRGVRLLSPSGSPGVEGTADWVDPENPTALLDKRWYPTSITLPDGRLLVMGGSDYGVEFNGDWCNTPTYEFLPRADDVVASNPMQFLWDTLPDNLYPAMFVLPSGRVFMFASYKAVLLDPNNNYNTLPVLQFVTGTADPVFSDTTTSSNSTSSNSTSSAADATTSAAASTGVAASSLSCVEESDDATQLTLGSCEYLSADSANLTSLSVSAQGFTFLRTNTSSSAASASGVIFGSDSGLCWSSSGSVGAVVNLTYCNPSDSTQAFVVEDSTITHEQSGLTCKSGSSSQIFGIPSSTRYFELSRLPGGPFRSYPWTAASIMLPLDPASDYAPEVLICGGSQLSCGWDCLTYDCQQSCQGNNASTLDSCGLINPERPWADANGTSTSGLAAWDMSDTLPSGRVMGDLINLPDGSTLLLNGAGAGMAGWDKGRDPTFQALLYQRYEPAGSRWKALDSSTVPRLYHSTVTLLPDGRVLVAGSAPNDPTSFSEQSSSPPAFDTEYRVEYYMPPYLTAGASRPQLQTLSATSWPTYNTSLSAIVANLDTAGRCAGGAAAVDFSLLQTGFRTHSTGHGQRAVWLRHSVVQDSGSTASFGILSPPDANIAPPGYYLLFAVCGGIPSEGVWVQIGGDPAGFADYQV